MGFLHYEFELSPDDVVEVTLDKQANVRLMSDGNYAMYRKGKNYRYTGGLAKTSRVHLSAPHAGHWHVVSDLGGCRGTVGASACGLSGA